MDGEKLKYQIGANIAALRKKLGMTQADLAARLNYSDKAISKWERGESSPDAVTLVEISEVFDTSVDELLGRQPRTVVQAVVQTVAAKGNRVRNGVYVLSSLLVWIVAMLAYVVFASMGLSKVCVVFIYAIPINAIVLLSLRSAFRDYRWNQVLISIIMWGCLLSVYASLLVFCGIHVWRIFLLGILGQAAVCLWFRMLCKGEKDG